MQGSVRKTGFMTLLRRGVGSRREKRTQMRQKGKNMTLVEKMKAEKENLLTQIAVLEMHIRKSPPGKLFILKNGVRERWYVDSPSGSSSKGRAYLRRKDNQFAEKLGKKAYWEAELEDRKRKVAAIDRWLNDELSFISETENLLDRSARIRKLISKEDKLPDTIHDWLNREHPVNSFHKENLVIETKMGMFVRSKSEHIIASALERKKIPYKYEILLEFSEGKAYLDFTILHPQTKQFYYWEHFGMMDDDQYFSRAVSKLRQYIRSGLVPGVNLIVTFETMDKPLSVQLVDAIVDYYFV